jgi:GT2 family glycosyltransferase
MYFEENEFCRRAAINGWDLKVNRRSRIYHKCGGSTDEGSVASPLKAYYITRNWILFVKNSSTNVERILGLLYMLSTRVIIFTYWLIFGGRDVAYAGLLGVKDGILNKDGKHPDYP